MEPSQTFQQDDSAVPRALGLAADAKGFISAEDRQRLFETLRIAENRTCFDCGARNASWISASYAIYLCLSCSGRHRDYESKVSFIRSIELDMIRLEEALRVELGGNARAKRFFRSHGVADGKLTDYQSKIGERYRKQLDKEVFELLSANRPELAKRRGAPVPKDESGAEPAQGLVERVGSGELKQPAAMGPEVTVKVPQVVLKSEDSPEKFGAGGGPAFFGSAGKAQQRAKASDFDFDFDDAFAGGGEGGSSSAGKRAVPVGPVATASAPAPSSSARLPSSRDFSNAKAISSSDFRNDGGNNCAANPKSSLARFKNAQAISSEAYFDKDSREAGPPPTTRWNEEEVATRIAILREGAIQKASEVAGAAHETIRNAASWFSKISSSPTYL